MVVIIIVIGLLEYAMACEIARTSLFPGCDCALLTSLLLRLSLLEKVLGHKRNVALRWNSSAVLWLVLT